ncbi:sugar ABC transporter substrate-binding protein [Streptomyces sp. NPDC020801]|uniref:sugar ABC transporter substrate-binding protein n=1 Tax=unclassified Streptomyces TaxID=2593676 RepID=UPI0037A4F5D1
MIKSRWVVVAALMSATLTACGPGSGDSAAPGHSDAPKKFTVAISNLGLNFPFPAAISKGIREKAAQLGVTIVTETDAQGKADKQSSDVQDIISQHPKGALLLPVDSTTSTKWADELKAAGITTVAVASQVGDPKTRQPEDVYPALAALVTQNEEQAGAKAGQLALKALPHGGQMAIVEGAAGFAENTTRVAKFQAAAKTAGVNLSVVASQPGDWVPDKAQAACQNMLQAHPKIKLFYALSDDMAVGCGKAIKAASSKAVVIGVGGSKLGVDAVKQGSVYGTVCYKPVDMGELAMQTLYDALAGKPQNSRFVTYPTPAITKDNVAECTPQW